MPSVPGPGPQPPTDGKPFFLILTITVNDDAGADELAKIQQSQKQWSLDAGAKSFSVGRNIKENSVSVIEQYDNTDQFHAVHSPELKSQDYQDTRKRIFELGGKVDVKFFHTVDF